MRVLLLVFVGLGLSFGGLSLRGQVVFYVDPFGNDSGAGTEADPFATIQHAIDSGLPGTRVIVQEGLYEENLSMRSGVDVLARGAELRGTAQVLGVVNFDSVDNARLSGLRIGVETPVPGLTRGVVFQGNCGPLAVVENCLFTPMQYGMFISSGSSPTVQNNTFYGGGSSFGAGEQGIYLGNQPAPALLRNNLIFGYRFAGVHVVPGSTAPTPTFEFNNIWDNQQNYRGFSDPTGTNGNLSIDPRLINPRGGDYRLSSSSPLIDEGTTEGAPEVDHIGTIRPSGNGVDIGAFEYSEVATLSRLFVSTSGDDNDTGGQLDPLRTIQHAIDVASPGGIVEVVEGVYEENIRMNTGVHVVSRGAEIRGQAAVTGVVNFTSVENAVLDGFRISLTSHIQGVSRGIVFEGSCSSSAAIQNCVVTPMQYGMFIWSGSSPTVRNNSLYGGRSTGGVGEQGIYLGNSASAGSLRNNVIFGYSVAGIHVVDGTQAQQLELISNNLWDNGMHYRGIPDQTGSNGNRAQSPQVRSEVAADLRLTANSPLIDSGATVALPQTDHLGRRRPVGSAVDIGAYEYSGTGFQNTLYVAPGGSDGSSGGINDPYGTIQHAIDVAPSGTRIQVADGAYRENLRMKTGVSVFGMGAEIRGQVTLDSVVNFSSVTNTTLSGFKITVETQEGSGRAVVFLGLCDETTVLSNCVIPPIRYGMFVWGAATPVIENNTFDGGGMGGGLGSHGISLGNSAVAAVIRNNAIFGYRFAGINVVAGSAQVTPRFRNNNIWGNTENYRGFPDQNGISDNISQDPQMVDPAGGDYRLMAGSPLIDAGTTVGSPAVDHVGTVRSSGNGVDIGAFEFAAGTVSANVVGRYVFYNNSSFDEVSDVAAIAPDKVAILPGETATFVNYTSYHKGLNGVMVDVAGLSQPGAIDASDFSFQVGNSRTLEAWTSAPAPLSITVDQGAGVAGSDRIKIIWPDNAIAGTWLEIRLLANTDTGLEETDVFYFGNAVGETGNSTANVFVNISGENGARQNPRNFLDPTPIDDSYDFNRDGRVDISDENIARQNGTNFLNALVLLDLAPSGSASKAGVRNQLEWQREGDRLMLRYSGRLLSSPTLDGTFKPVINAESPYIVAGSGLSRFYRVDPVGGQSISLE